MEINGEVFEQCSANYKKSRQEWVLCQNKHGKRLIATSPNCREKARQRQRESKWQTLRDEAFRNKPDDAPVPPSLLAEVVPQGTYNPHAEQQDFDDPSFAEIDEEGLLPHAPPSFTQDPEAQSMEHDDVHGDLVSILSLQNLSSVPGLSLDFVVSAA